MLESSKKSLKPELPKRGYRVVYVTCEFAKTSLDIKIVFDVEGKIAGLWFVSAKTEGIHGIYIAALIATGISILMWAVWSTGFLNISGYILS